MISRICGQSGAGAGLHRLGRHRRATSRRAGTPCIVCRNFAENRRWRAAGAKVAAAALKARSGKTGR